jgi:hypothetical protein
MRQLNAELRRAELTELMKKGGIGPGAATRYARALGVHPSTVGRDLAILFAGLDDRSRGPSAGVFEPCEPPGGPQTGGEAIDRLIGPE